MNRFAKNSVRYKPTAEKISPRGAPVGAQTIRSAQWAIRGLLKRGSLEFIIFILLSLGMLRICAVHSYFQLSDKKISGSDTETTVRIQHVLSDYLEGTTFGLRHSSFMFFKSSIVEAEIKKQVAIDSITIQKKFPHTLIISATEIPIAARVIAENGQALVSADGQVVRWYDTTSTLAAFIERPAIILGRPLAASEHELLARVVEKRTVDLATRFERTAGSMVHDDLSAIALKPDDPQLLELHFVRGLVVLMTQDADYDVQFQKVQAASTKLVNPKRIDVRFGDKVFVSY